MPVSNDVHQISVHDDQVSGHWCEDLRNHRERDDDGGHRCCYGGCLYTCWSEDEGLDTWDPPAAATCAQVVTLLYGLSVVDFPLARS